jgi:hypothetical protein
MTTKNNFANLMLMSIVAITTISLTSCKDDSIDDNKKVDEVVTAKEGEMLLEPIGLVYNDFITPYDVTILNADTTEVSVSKALADKMGITNFVNHPMGIWDDKNHDSYLCRATEQRLLSDRYILKVTRSTLAEVLQGRDIVLNTSLYYNPERAMTRGADNGMSGEAAKYIDENNVVHPAAITIKPEYTAMTRSGESEYETYTVEEIMGNRSTTRGWFGDAWNWVKKKVNNTVEYVVEKTTYTIDGDKKTCPVIRHKSELKKDMKFECGPAEGDSINVNFKCPLQFDLDYTLEIHAKGNISTAMIPKLNYLETYFDGYFAMNPELTLGFSKKVALPKDKQRVNLCKMSGLGMTFMIGIVPVHIDFDPSIYLKFTAELEGSATVGINYDFATKFRAGMKYNGSWSSISNGEIVKNEFNLIKPNVALEAKAGVGLMFGIDVIIDKIAGPSIAMGPQVNAKASLTYSYWKEGGEWDFKAKATAGCGGEVGAKIKVFGYELAEWKCPFEIGPQKTIFEYPKSK